MLTIGDLLDLTRPGLFNTYIPLATTKHHRNLWADLGKDLGFILLLKSTVKASPLHRAVGLGSQKLQFDFEVTCGSRKSTTPLGKCQDNY